MILVHIWSETALWQVFALLSCKLYIICTKSILILPCNGLGDKKFIQSHVSIESAPSAILDAAMREDRLVVDGHAVDVYGTVTRLAYDTSNFTAVLHLPRFNLLGKGKTLSQILREDCRR